MTHALQEGTDKTSAAAAESGKIDALYVFGCFVMWRKDRDDKWHQEILTAAGYPDEEVSIVANFFLQRCERLAEANAYANAGGGELCRS